MYYFFQDLSGVAAASLLAALLLILPGFGLLELVQRSRLVDGEGYKGACWGLLLGVSVMPAIDALLLRWCGFAGILGLHILLAPLGIRRARNAIGCLPRRWWLAVLGAWLAIVWSNVDFDWHHRLYQPLTIVDGVKHAAVISALAQSGLPLQDPFFARQSGSGYYYYFYLAPALLRWLGGTLVESRAAFAASSFITLVCFPAVLFLLADAAALIPDHAKRRFVRIILFLCCVSGLDLLPGVAIAAMTGITLPQLDWWSEEVRWVLTSILWVPHHMSAVVATFTACLIVSRGRSCPASAAILAGIMFATVFGCSVWVAVAAVPIIGLWWVLNLKDETGAPFWVLPVSAVVALIVLAPQIYDLAAGRSLDGAPLGLWIRTLGPIKLQPQSIGAALFWIAMNPGGYLIEFGVFAIGAFAFLKSERLQASRNTQIGRLLLVGAPLALLMGTFIRSTIIYNDFGWRAMWFAEVPALLWTASVLSAGWTQTLPKPLWIGAIAIGLAGTTWDLAGLRLLRQPDFNVSLSFVNAHPEVDYDERGTYQWINRMLPAAMVVQHDPPITRAFDFGLYGTHRVAVADVQARLFGADETSVEKRLALLAPIYQRPMPISELRDRAAAAGVGAILLTSVDPVWALAGAPPSDWACNYRSAHTCVMVLQ